MTTTRTPIGRPPKARITPAAIAAFKKMLELEEACSCAPINWEKYWERERCAACKQWWEQHSVLWRELKLPPWIWPAYEHPGAVTPYPEGSHAAKSWQPDLKGQERYRLLCVAAELEEEEEA